MPFDAADSHATGAALYSGRHPTSVGSVAASDTFKGSKRTATSASAMSRPPGDSASTRVKGWISVSNWWFVPAAVAALGVAIGVDLLVFRSGMLPRGLWHSFHKQVAGPGTIATLPPNPVAIQVPEVMGAEAFADFPEQELVFTGTIDGLLHRMTVGYADHTAIKVDSRALLRLNNSDVGDGSSCGTPENEAACGRILGLKVTVLGTDRTPSIVACDAVRGLVLIEDVANDDRGFMEYPVSVLTNLVDDSEDRPTIRFCNAVEVRGDSVFFTDSSKYSRTEFLQDMLDGSPSGRLLRYDFSTGKTHTIIDKLHFANGISLNHEEDALLIAELRSSRVLRLPFRLLDGHSDINLPIDATTNPEFLRWSEQLPVYPDNIQLFPDGSSYLIGGPFRTPTGISKIIMSSNVVRQTLRQVPSRLAWKLVNLLNGGSTSHTLLLRQDGSIDTALDLSQIGPSSQLSDSFETKWSRVLLLGSYGRNPLVVAPGIASLLLN